MLDIHVHLHLVFISHSKARIHYCRIVFSAFMSIVNSYWVKDRKQACPNIKGSGAGNNVLSGIYCKFSFKLSAKQVPTKKTML